MLFQTEVRDNSKTHKSLSYHFSNNLNCEADDSVESLADSDGDCEDGGGIRFGCFHDYDNVTCFFFGNSFEGT